jgi:hypothetical protein
MSTKKTTEPKKPTRSRKRERRQPMVYRFVDLQDLGLVNNWPQLKILVEQHGFPPGFLLGVNTRAWLTTDIDKWITSRPVSRDEVVAA